MVISRCILYQRMLSFNFTQLRDTCILVTNYVI